jgi:polar amino acid transport system substrate-binding protein
MRPRLVPCMAAVVLLASTAAAQAPRTLTFCTAGHHLPPGADPEGQLEAQLARALGRGVGTEARVRWIEGDSGTVEEAVREGRCDAALGVIVDPGPMAPKRDLAGLALTAPYAGTGYVLIRRADAPPAPTLSGLGERRIAVETESVPIYTLRHRGNRVHALHDYHAVVEAVTNGRADYGYLWGPLAGWLLRGRQDVVIATEFQPVDRWEFAVAIRDAEGGLRESLNGAIHALFEDGSIMRIFRKYHVPLHSPARGQKAGLFSQPLPANSSAPSGIAVAQAWLIVGESAHQRPR